MNIFFFRFQYFGNPGFGKSQHHIKIEDDELFDTPESSKVAIGL